MGLSTRQTCGYGNTIVDTRTIITVERVYSATSFTHNTHDPFERELAILMQTLRFENECVKTQYKSPSKKKKYSAAMAVGKKQFIHRRLNAYLHAPAATPAAAATVFRTHVSRLYLATAIPQRERNNSFLYRSYCGDDLFTVSLNTVQRTNASRSTGRKTYTARTLCVLLRVPEHISIPAQVSLERRRRPYDRAVCRTEGGHRAVLPDR